MSISGGEKMAQQSLFDALAGVDNSAYLAVQSILDTQPIHDENASHQTTIQPSEEEDVFQCGKCRTQFTSLSLFVNHKQQPCAPASRSTTLQPPQRQSIAPVYAVAQTSSVSSNSATLNQFPANIVLPDDMMTLALDSNTAGSLHHVQQQSTGAQNNPFLSSAQMNSNPQQTIVSVPLSSIGGTIGQPIQLHPINVITSQAPSGPVVVSSQQQQGNVFSNGGEGTGILTVLVDDAGQSLQPEHSQAYLTNEDQGALRGTDPMMAPQKPLPVTRSKTKTAKKLLKPVKSCPWCTKTFVKNFDLQQHLRAHTGEKPFQCVVCGRAFSQKSNVKKHMASHKVWPLGGANNSLPEQPAPHLVIVEDRSLQKIKGNKKVVDPNLNNECKEGEVDSDQSAVGEPNTAYPENASEKNREDDIASMQWHFLVDSSYVCPYCPNAQTRFTTYLQLKSHLTTHTSEQVYKCVMTSCDKTFQELDDFLEHTRDHESRNELTYRCHVCNKEFPSLDELGNHQYIHSVPTQSVDNKRKRSGWKFKCIECGNVYSTPEALEHHASTSSHTYPCQHCAKVYQSPRLLRKHLLSHKEPVEFECHICKKPFKSEYYLKVHHRIHTGERPFECEICKMKFDRRDKLVRHTSTHNPTKKFVCPFREVTGCDKAFQRSDKLKEHMLKHKKVSISKVVGSLSDDPHGVVGAMTRTPKDGKICPHCENCVFENEEELIAHKVLCSQVPRMKCRKCLLTFNTQASYTTHLCRPLLGLPMSRIGSVSVNYERKKPKRKKPPRIELSPPPVKRSRRGTRTRAGHSDGESTSKGEAFSFVKQAPVKSEDTEDASPSHDCLGDEYSTDAQSEFLSRVLLVRNSQNNNANYCDSSVEGDQHSQDGNERDGAESVGEVEPSDKNKVVDSNNTALDVVAATIKCNEDTPYDSENEALDDSIIYGDEEQGGSDYDGFNEDSNWESGESGQSGDDNEIHLERVTDE